jgi:hypothetical protein
MRVVPWLVLVGASLGVLVFAPATPSGIAA